MALTIQLLALSAIFFVGINAHGYFSSLTIDGVNYPEGTCIRPDPSSKYDYPISSIDNPAGLQSADMTCGWLPNAAKASKSKCPVKPGSSVTAQFHYEKGDPSDTFYIDPSHKGPCLVYMAKSDTGAGAVWFKIFHDGYDSSTKQFCVDKMRANKGRFTFTIPTDIAPGNYLLRMELIALHEGFELGGAQPYVHCAEVTVSGSGTVVPSTNLVAFPGAYQASDKGLFFDIYPVKGAYPIPGPPLYVSGASSSGTTPTTPAPSASTTKSSTTKAASTTTTTSKATTKAATTKKSQSSSSTTTTTGGSSGSTPAPTTPAPTSAPTSAPSGDCTLGYEKCASTNSYVSCYRASSSENKWSAERPCQAGLVCKPWLENHVICDRP